MTATPERPLKNRAAKTIKKADFLLKSAFSSACVLFRRAAVLSAIFHAAPS
ncbi:MAG: hypothetical protein Q4C72_01295 [Eubacteriales bacterium]|nr:hypothetical protein [Eubacteriales bacterium]